jgi:hypothetical protein
MLAGPEDHIDGGGIWLAGRAALPQHDQEAMSRLQMLTGSWTLDGFDAFSILDA